jgi:hypothetical protein
MRTEVNQKIDLNTLEHSSWLASWPYGIRELPDSVFVFSIHFRLGIISPIIPHCKSNPTITFKDQNQCFDHVTSCVHCGGIFNHLRHEFINNNLSKLFTYYSLPHVLNPPDYPLPLNDRGGPDFILYLNEKIIAGDVTVTKNKTKTAYTNKKRIYSEFSSRTGFTIFPMCVSFTGMIALDSLRFFKDIAYELHRPSFYFDAVDCVQFSLLRGLFAALQVSLARLKCYADDGSYQKRSLETQMFAGGLTDEEQWEVNEMLKQTKPQKNPRTEPNSNEDENQDGKGQTNNTQGVESTKNQNAQQNEEQTNVFQKQMNGISRDQSATSDFVERDPSAQLPQASGCASVWKKQMSVR